MLASTGVIVNGASLVKIVPRRGAPPLPESHELQVFALDYSLFAPECSSDAGTVRRQLTHALLARVTLLPALEFLDSGLCKGKPQKTGTGQKQGLHRKFHLRATSGRA